MTYEEELAMRRAELAARYGGDNVWTTAELERDFRVLGFLAPYVHVVRKSDGAEGSVEFVSNPRVYFGFVPRGRK